MQLLILFALAIRPWQQHVREHMSVADRPRPNTSDVSLHLVSQPLDHFDATERRRWSQRVFVRSTFFTPGGPVFLCVGGEGPPIDASALVASAHCNDAVELAPVLGALLVAAEHRFFGPTGGVRPLPTFTLAELRFQSSAQAVEDLAGVHAAVGALLALAPRANRWVTFGGSYPGLVAGYARVRLPHLFHAAVSSSAPWVAKVDMAEYNDVVARALADPEVGGSAACEAAVRDGHALVLERLYSGQGRRALEAQFGFCTKGVLDEREAALSWVGGGVLSVPAQSNDPGCRAAACDIRSICEMLLADEARDVAATHAPLPQAASSHSADLLERLAAVSAAQRGGACVPTSDFDPAVVLAELLDPSSGARAWTYQTCAEYGFFQTCETGTRCPFGRGALQLRASLEMCKRVFGIGADQVAANVAATNARYGGATPGGQRILFTNGDVDPWSSLGVLSSPDGNRSEPVFLARGVSHHAWTHPADEITQPSVREAKELVWRYVTSWLRDDYSHH